MIYSAARPVGSKRLNELTDLAVDAQQAEEIIIEPTRKNIDSTN